MTTPVLDVTEFEAPLLNPSAAGLYGVTRWTEENGPPRWLSQGVRVKPWNYPGELSSGLWSDPWCPEDLGSDEGGLKTGERPDILDPFDSLTVWAYDSTQCGDLSEASRNEARLRAQQTLRLEEQTVVEREFAARLLLDAGAPTVETDLVAAVGALELAFAATNTTGYIHASAKWAAVAARDNLLSRSGGAGMRTPLGNRWVFGYATALGETLVASSQPFGWRDSVQLRESVAPQTNEFIAIAERSVVIGYEALIGAVTVTP